jgi:HEPN domain-containing protein
MVEITEKNYSNMKENLEYANGLIIKAINLFLKAYEEFKKDYPIYSNVISLCIEAMELAVKAIFKIKELEYPKEHQLLFNKKGRFFLKQRNFYKKYFMNILVLRIKL